MADKKLTVSGFCSIKHCEGTKPTGALSGRPMKTCSMDSETCSCNCHKQLDMMFEMAGMERVSQENPEYTEPPELEGLRKCLAEIRLMKVTKATEQAPPVYESIAPDVLPPSAQAAFTETPSGRKQRGQLEDEVQKATDMWVMLKATLPCTPTWVAEMIDANNPPSTGAVNAVFERWAAYGFATIEKKPTRFTGYTEAGVKQGLPALKAAYKSGKRLTAAAAGRGTMRR